MSNSFFVLRFAAAVAVVVLVQLSTVKDVAASAVDSQQDLPSIEVNFDVLDKFAPQTIAPVSKKDLGKRANIANADVEKSEGTTSEKPKKPTVSKETKKASPKSSAAKDKGKEPQSSAVNTNKTTAPAAEPAPVTIRSQKPQASQPADAQQSTSAPVFKTAPEPIIKPEVKSTDEKKIPSIAAEPPVKSDEKAAIVSAQEIDLPAIPKSSSATEPETIELPKTGVAVTVSPNVKENTKSLTSPQEPALPSPSVKPAVSSGVSPADLEEAKKALAPIKEIKPTVAEPSKEENKTASLPSLPEPAAVELTPMPAPLPPAGEMAASLLEPTKKDDTKSEKPSPAVSATTAPQAVADTAIQPPAMNNEAKPANSTSGKGNLDLSIKFLSTETAVPLAAEADLKKLASRLKDSKARVNLIAYAAGTSDKATTARRVSLSRALAIRAYLIEHDIDKLRINVQAEGDKNPNGDPDRVDIFVDMGKTPN